MKEESDLFERKERMKGVNSKSGEKMLRID